MAFDVTDSGIHAVILHSAFYIYGSKVGVHYRSTLFEDLNLEITFYFSCSDSDVKKVFFRLCFFAKKKKKKNCFFFKFFIFFFHFFLKYGININMYCC